MCSFSLFVNLWGVDMPGSTLESALAPLGERLWCDQCRESLQERVRQLIVQWSVVKVCTTLSLSEKMVIYWGYLANYLIGVASPSWTLISPVTHLMNHPPKIRFSSQSSSTHLVKGSPYTLRLSFSSSCTIRISSPLSLSVSSHHSPPAYTVPKT